MTVRRATASRITESTRHIASAHRWRVIAVNEAYMRLADYTRMQWQDRAHFFAVSAQVMRRILVDHARRHNVKRGGGVQHISLDEVMVVAPAEDGKTDLVALDGALTVLARIDPRKPRSSRCVSLAG